MTPMSFEGAVDYFRTTADRLNKATIRLDEALKVVNDVLVESIDEEVEVEYLDLEIVSVGIFAFEFKDVFREEKYQLALGICLKEWVHDTAGGCLRKRYPLVQLSGKGAPQPASRKYRAWAGRNLVKIIEELAAAVNNAAQQVERAAESSIDAASKISDAELAELRKFEFLSKKHGGLWLAELNWIKPSGKSLEFNPPPSLEDSRVHDFLDMACIRPGQGGKGEAILFSDRREAEKYKQAVERYADEHPCFIAGPDGHPQDNKEGMVELAWVPEVTLRPIGPLDAAAFFVFGLVRHSDENRAIELEVPSNGIYECEVGIARGAERLWKKMPVEEAILLGNVPLRCIECKGPIRLHRAGPGGRPRAHAEHQPGHAGCSLGHYFDGRRRPSPQPVE